MRNWRLPKGEGVITLEFDFVVARSAVGAARKIHVWIVRVDIAALFAAKDSVFTGDKSETAPALFGIPGQSEKADKHNTESDDDDAFEFHAGWVRSGDAITGGWTMLTLDCWSPPVEWCASGKSGSPR